MNAENRKHGISVIIPCLNEAESIGAVVEAAREGSAATGLPAEILVIDNGSSEKRGDLPRPRSPGPS